MRTCTVGGVFRLSGFYNLHYKSCLPDKVSGCGRMRGDLASEPEWLNIEGVEGVGQNQPLIKTEYRGYGVTR